MGYLEVVAQLPKDDDRDDLPRQLFDRVNDGRVELVVRAPAPTMQALFGAHLRIEGEMHVGLCQCCAERSMGMVLRRAKAMAWLRGARRRADLASYACGASGHVTVLELEADPTQDRARCWHCDRAEAEKYDQCHEGLARARLEYTEDLSAECQRTLAPMPMVFGGALREAGRAGLALHDVALLVWQSLPQSCGMTAGEFAVLAPSWYAASGCTVVAAPRDRIAEIAVRVGALDVANAVRDLAAVFGRPGEPGEVPVLVAWNRKIVLATARYEPGEASLGELRPEVMAERKAVAQPLIDLASTSLKASVRNVRSPDAASVYTVLLAHQNNVALMPVLGTPPENTKAGVHPVRRDLLARRALRSGMQLLAEQLTAMHHGPGHVTVVVGDDLGGWWRGCARCDLGIDG